MKQAAIAALLTALKNDEKFVERLSFLAEQNGSEIIETACDTIVTKVLIDKEGILDFCRKKYPGVKFDSECHPILKMGRCEGIYVYGRLHNAFRSVEDRYGAPWYRPELYSLTETKEKSVAYDTQDSYTISLDILPEELYSVKTI